MSEFNTFNPNNPEPTQKNNIKLGIVALIISILVFVGGAASFFGVFDINGQNQQETKITERITSEAKEIEEDADEQVVSFSSQKEIKKLDIFDLSKDEFDYSLGEYRRENAKFFEVGEFNSGKYEGAKLILADVPVDAPFFYAPFNRFVLKDDGSIVLLANHSIDVDGVNNGLDANKFTIDEEYIVEQLNFPEEITGPEADQVLTLDKDYKAYFDITGLKKSFTHSEYGPVYTDKISPSSEVANLKNGFLLRAPDGTAVLYKYTPHFIDDSNVPKITWSSGEVNRGEYAFTKITGCGSSNYANIDPTITMDRLVVGGKNNKGENIFVYKDMNDPDLKRVYDEEYYAFENQTKLSYEEYMKLNPVFFWTDPFDRLIRFQNLQFVAPAECGKPVIYLYPEKTSEISVEVFPEGGFTFTEPAYGDGWQVVSTPNSEIYEIEDPKKTIWPYLFWEGRGGYYEAPDQGFVVERKNVEKFLVEKLGFLGMNKKEIADFNEFWLPRMQDNPYYFISFLGNLQMDALAPLEIEPKPDTVIRILMDYKGLDKPIKHKQQRLTKAPAREGFTVIEWGGVIR